MKRLLIVAYYFPPSGGPGVQRVLKFAKYLPEFGWHPVVLTVNESASFPARDESLVEEIPPSVKVYRTKIFEPYEIYRKLTGKRADTPIDVNVIHREGERRRPTERIAELVRATFFIPDARIGWYPCAVRAGKKIIEEEHIDAIYSSSPPYTAALIAKRLHRWSGKPWVAGFRDPWTGFLSTPQRWFLPRLIDRHLEVSVFRTASAIEVAWTGIMKDALRKYPDLPESKLFYLPNGFDSADYPPLALPRNERFTLTYTGSMYGKRNPSVLLQAVERLAASGEIDPSKIELRFIGRFGSEVHEMFRTFKCQGALRILPYLPHGESIRHLLQSDVLLLIVDEAEGKEEIVPGKVFEYIGSRRPILALAPEGAVSALIHETKAGIVVPSDDVNSVAKAFLEYYRHFVYNDLRSVSNEEAIARYERRNITKNLAELLDRLVDKSSSNKTER